MNQGRTVFSQLTQLLPRYEFRKCVNRYSGDRKVHRFKCWDQLLVMMFAQYSRRESLRDIEHGVRAMGRKAYHCGIKSEVSKSNLSHANQHRDWRIWSDFAQVLIGHARELYLGHNPALQSLDQIAYAFDSTTIELSLKLFPWARFRTARGAIKLHTQLDLQSLIPTFIKLTEGAVHDVNILDELVLEPGAIYVFDRGYYDFERLHRFQREGAFFLTKAKRNFRYDTVEQLPVDHQLNILSDQLVRLVSFYPRKLYPDLLRRTEIDIPDQDRKLVVISNQFQLEPSLIAALYKERWKIELFFKWIKQHLKVRRFYGVTDNAVLTQIWIAIISYLTVVIALQKLKTKISPHTFLQIISSALTEKHPLETIIRDVSTKQKNPDNDDQLQLWK